MLKPQSRKARLVRRRAHAYAEKLELNAGRMGYAEVRPMRSFPTPYGQIPKHDTDCSESTAIILEASGAPTPYVVARAGYTGTMLAKLPHIRQYQTRRGDLAVFVSPEHPDGVHVVMLLEGGAWHRDPKIWSHGQPGVNVTSLSNERAGFPGDGIVFLRAVPIRL